MSVCRKSSPLNSSGRPVPCAQGWSVSGASMVGACSAAPGWRQPAFFEARPLRVVDRTDEEPGLKARFPVPGSVGSAQSSAYWPLLHWYMTYLGSFTSPFSSNAIGPRTVS